MHDDASAIGTSGLAPSSIVLGNALRAYRDRPAKWDAWNIDAGYERRPIRIRFDGAEIVDGALEVRFHVGDSPGVMRIALAAGEAFLRVETALDWNESHVLLRVESDVALRDARARFGEPHGVVERSLANRTKAERAKFEVPGQRYVRLDGRHVPTGVATGLALFSLDGYGWNARSTGPERITFGHSLVRAPRWPDPDADRGEQTSSLAYAPLAATTGNGEVEALWQRFAGAPALAMFSSDDTALAIVATKLADDGDGVIVRARECDGEARDVSIRCAARANAVVECDALERDLAADVVDESARAPYALREGTLATRFAPFQLRSFRVRLA
jgi:alpha-mannosidase